MKKIATLFRLSASNSWWYQHLCVDSFNFKVVLSNTEYIGKDGSSMSEKQYEKSELRNQKKKFLATLPKAIFNALIKLLKMEE